MPILSRRFQVGIALCALSVWPTGVRSARAADALWLDAARSSITNGELLSHAAFLGDDMLEGREAGSRGGHAAAKYVLERLEASGLEPAGFGGRFTQPFSGNSQNLLAVLPGTDPALRDQYILVGAHYDHVGYGTRRNSYGPIGFIHNGADDNASGVSTLLEVIDALAQVDHRPRRSILFAFWDGEEKGLLGSKYWIRNPTVPLASLQLAWNLDMVGRMEGGRIEIMGARTGAGLRQLLSNPTLGDGTWVDFTWEYKDNSDHWTFYQAGIPSLCLHTGLHDDYHRPSDDVEKLNIEGMRLIGRYFLEQLCEMADADQLPGFRSQSRFETPYSQKRFERPLPDLAPRIDFTWSYQAGAQPTLLVKSVPLRSPAQEAGLRAGDAIVTVDDMPITNAALLPAVALRNETQITVTVARDGVDEPVTLEIPLTGEPVSLGLSWRENPAEPGAVYVTRVVPYSPAALAGVRLFDRIYALDGAPLDGQKDLLTKVSEHLAGNSKSLRLEIESRGQLREAIISLELPTAESGDSSL